MTAPSGAAINDKVVNYSIFSLIHWGLKKRCPNFAVDFLKHILTFWKSLNFEYNLIEMCSLGFYNKKSS